MKKTATLLLCLLAAVTFHAISAHAETLTFEDLKSHCDQGQYYYNLMPSGYGGLKWNNFFALDTVKNDEFQHNTGWGQRLNASGIICLFNGSGKPASVMESTSSFVLHSAYLTATWNDGLSVSAEGYSGGVLKYSKTVTLSAYSPTLISYEFSNIDKVVWTSWGGVPVSAWKVYGGGTQFAMDNLNYDVPEPSSILVLLLGVGGFGKLIRRKKSA